MTPTTVIAVPIWDTEGAHRFDEHQSFYTMNFIDQMQRLDDDSWLCVIVDNASDSQPTLDFLAALNDPRFHVIHNETNRGYGAAANQGVDYGLKRGAHFVIVCNNDLEFLRQDWIEVAFINHLRTNPGWLMGARYIPDNGWTKFGESCIPYMEGYLLACTAGMWIDLGGFDENYLAYMEDVDLSYRAMLRGYQLVQSPLFHWEAVGAQASAIARDVAVHHIGGRTGYNRADFDFDRITRESVEYFKKKHGFCTHK